MSSGKTSNDLWLEGGCHCAAIRFRVRVEKRTVNACNCSICSKKGFLGLIVPAEAFEILRGADSLEVYRFNTRVAGHHFCRICGVHPFSQPRSHPDGFDVNVRCLDEWSGEGVDEGAGWEVRPFDGQHWEASVASIRDDSM
jgi:hypothetical protein